LDVGEVSDPILIGDSWVVFKVLERPPSQIPPYVEARAQVHERVYMEKLTTAREHWLKGLRRRTHVEVRL
jgi:peptidyl-prolyl cis-trans isomerase SurA